MSTETIEVARGDLRLLVLAAGYCLLVLNGLPDGDDDPNECQASLVADLTDAGVVRDDGDAGISWLAFARAVQRGREQLLSDDGRDVQPGPAVPKE